MSILKNPILVALIVGGIVYGFMYYQEDSKYKKDTKYKKKNVSILTPAVIAIISWFIASSYTSNTNTSNTNTTSNTNITEVSKPIQNIQNMAGGAITNTDVNKNIINKNIINNNINNSLDIPDLDVFIDLARFT